MQEQNQSGTWNIKRTWLKSKRILCACIVLALALVWGIFNTSFEYFLTSPNTEDGVKCRLDLRSNNTLCCPLCDGASFSLPGMTYCHPWLDCDAIRYQLIVTDQVIGAGAVKVVKLGQWKEHDVAVNFLRDKSFLEDYLHNVQMLKLFNSKSKQTDFLLSDQVVQLIGFCNEQHIVVTEYHPLGSADGIKMVLRDKLEFHDSISTRFSLCLDFVRILVMLHNGIEGKRVLCDANDPKKALSQFLLSVDFHLVLNDMDALPLVNEAKGILAKCGHKELYGQYVAPEQMWPYEEIEFDDSLMPGYNEKVDIWKIPDIFNYLTDVTGSNKLKLHLFNIHARCKSLKPDLRPSAEEVYQEYEKFFHLHIQPSKQNLL